MRVGSRYPARSNPARQNSSRLPSDDQEGDSTSPTPCPRYATTVRAAPPPAGTIAIDRVTLRGRATVRAKAISEPSGDHAGESWYENSVRGGGVIGRRSLPSARIVQMRVSSTSRPPAYAMRAPSGDHEGCVATWLTGGRTSGERPDPSAFITSIPLPESNAIRAGVAADGVAARSDARVAAMGAMARSAALTSSARRYSR